MQVETWESPRLRVSSSEDSRAAPIQGFVTDCAFVPDGNLFITASLITSVKVLEVAGSGLGLTLDGHWIFDPEQ